MRTEETKAFMGQHEYPDRPEAESRKSSGLAAGLPSKDDEARTDGQAAALGRMLDFHRDFCPKRGCSMADRRHHEDQSGESGSLFNLK